MSTVPTNSDSPPPTMIPPVEQLITASHPRPGDPTSWMMAAMVVCVIALFLINLSSADQNGALSGITTAAVLGLFAASYFVRSARMKRFRREHAMLEAAEEMIQLRHWPQGAALLGGLLSAPMMSQGARVQALMYLTTVLARVGRFEDVAAIHEYLLAVVPMGEPSIHAVRLGRAMALLREDRLFDADKAISELRRSPIAEDSSGLALVEIYRDAKTGHYAEAIAEFDKKRRLLRDQLGHRSADAWILAAKARHMAGQSADAQTAVTNATLLAPPGELSRRYPEVADLFGIYAAAPRPAGVA